MRMAGMAVAIYVVQVLLRLRAEEADGRWNRLLPPVRTALSAAGQGRGVYPAPGCGYPDPCPPGPGCSPRRSAATRTPASIGGTPTVRPSARATRHGR